MAPKGPLAQGALGRRGQPRPLPVTGNFLPGHPYQLAPTDDMDARNSSHLSPGIARAHGARQTHFSRGAP